jgi:hypothetical protein
MERTIFILKLWEILPGFLPQDLKEISELKEKIDKYEDLKKLLQNISRDGHYIAIISPDKQFNKVLRLTQAFDALFLNINQKDFFDEFDLDVIVTSFNSKFPLYSIKKNDNSRIVLISDKPNDTKLELTQLEIDPDKYQEMKEEADEMDDLIYPPPRKISFLRRHNIKISIGGIIGFLLLGSVIGIILEMTHQISVPESMVGAAIIGGVFGFVTGVGIIGGTNVVLRCRDCHQPMFSLTEDLSAENSALLRNQNVPRYGESVNTRFSSSPIPGFSHLLDSKQISYPNKSNKPEALIYLSDEEPDSNRQKY